MRAGGSVEPETAGQRLVARLGPAPFEVLPNMRIAQMVVAPVTRLNWAVVDELPDSERGAGGFGSTGTGASKG